MKFKIAINDIQYVCKMVRDVISKDDDIPASSAVRIMAGTDTAEFIAFNRELAVRVKVKIDGSVEGEAVVDAASLYGAVSYYQPANDKGLGSDPISFALSKNQTKLTISTRTHYSNEKSVLHKRVLPLVGCSFPDSGVLFDTEEETLSFSLPAGLLLDGLDCVCYALSNDLANIVFTGVYFKADPQVGFTFTATNGVCLAEYKVPFDYKGPPIETVIPGPLAAKYSSSFFDEDILSLKLSGNKLKIESTNLVVIGALIQSEYPDYASVLPAADKSITMDTAVLLDNLNNLLIDSRNVDDNRVRFLAEGRSVRLICGTSENSDLDCEGDTSILNFDANLKLLAMSLKNFTGDKVKISYLSSESPIYLYPLDKFANGATLKCVLVPLTPDT